eukprot:scaffold275742_cov33-Tisochrysis_lutea.AAC.3
MVEPLAWHFNSAVVAAQLLQSTSACRRPRSSESRQSVYGEPASASRCSTVPKESGVSLLKFAYGAPRCLGSSLGRCGQWAASDKLSMICDGKAKASVTGPLESARSTRGMDLPIVVERSLKALLMTSAIWSSR